MSLQTASSQSDWKDYPMNYEEVHKIDVHFTFNEVTRNAWETAKEEINSILKNAKGHDLINLFEMKNQLMHKYYHYSLQEKVNSQKF